jgi:hypothetical protein
MQHFADRSINPLRSGEFIALFGSYAIGYPSAQSDIDILHYSPTQQFRLSTDLQNVQDVKPNIIRWQSYEMPLGITRLYEPFVLSTAQFIAGSRSSFRRATNSLHRALQRHRIQLLSDLYALDPLLDVAGATRNLSGFCKYGPGGFHQEQFIAMLVIKYALNPLAHQATLAALADTRKNNQRMARIRDWITDAGASPSAPLPEVACKIKILQDLKGENRLRLITLLNDLKTAGLQNVTCDGNFSNI